MSFHESFSDRQKRLRGTSTPVTYSYDSVPQRLRGQIVYLLDDALGYSEEGKQFWRSVERTYIRSLGLERLEVPAGTKTTILGVFATGSEPYLGSESEKRVKDFIRRAPVTEVLDMLDLCFSVLSQSRVATFSKRQRADRGIEHDFPSIAEEINLAFLRSGVGYRFVGSELVKMTDEVLHSQVVEPALRLLHA